MLYGVAGCLFCFGGTLLILIVLWGYVRRKVMKAMSEGSPAPFARKAYGRPGVALVADLIHWGFIGAGKVFAAFVSKSGKTPLLETRAGREDFATRVLEYYFSFVVFISLGLLMIFVFATLPFRASVLVQKNGEYTWPEKYVFWYTNPANGERYNLCNIKGDLMINGNPYPVAVVTTAWSDGVAEPVGEPCIVEPNDTVTISDAYYVDEFGQHINYDYSIRTSGNSLKIQATVVDRVPQYREHLDAGEYNYPTTETMRQIVLDVLTN